jgi:hypothetical protein
MGIAKDSGQRSSGTVSGMKRLITATVLTLTILVTGCSQEPPTVNVELDNNVWQEYAACIDSVAAESSEEVIADLLDDPDITANDIRIDALINALRAIAATDCAELRPPLTTDE